MWLPNPPQKKLGKKKGGKPAMTPGLWFTALMWFISGATSSSAGAGGGCTGAGGPGALNLQRASGLWRFKWLQEEFGLKAARRSLGLGLRDEFQKFQITIVIII